MEKREGTALAMPKGAYETKALAGGRWLGTRSVEILVKPPGAPIFDQLQQTKPNIKLEIVAQFPSGIAILKIEGQKATSSFLPPLALLEC
jgi:hypothetical protein